MVDFEQTQGEAALRASRRIFELAESAAQEHCRPARRRRDRTMFPNDPIRNGSRLTSSCPSKVQCERTLCRMLKDQRKVDFPVPFSPAGVAVSHSSGTTDLGGQQTGRRWPAAAATRPPSRQGGRSLLRGGRLLALLAPFVAVGSAHDLATPRAEVALAHRHPA